ncbi:MAG: 3-oxoacyl-ACP reductase FabG [Myxococcales bacterium]|nr:3-oxoacyl-ACP reductase FabG [Myxococcales bacterium]
MSTKGEVERPPRRVLVTGGGRGIGRAIALALARDGFDLSLGYLQSKAEAESAAAEIESLGRRAIALCFDVADREACEQAINADIEAHGPYWGAVCNAGIHSDAPFPGMSGEAWDRVIRTNLDGFYNTLHPLVMPMVRGRRGGRIVAITSVAGLAGNRGQVNYSASKAGLVGATKSLAQELAKREITVNCVAPGWIDTEMLKGADVTSLAGMVPMRRLGTPEDVAAAVAFLMSAGASYITGQVLSVNGGIY